MKYRITKYNSKNREENGTYKFNEWTSISDIGNDFYDTILTKEEYLQTEKKYLSSISILLDNFNSRGIIINKLEKNFTYKEIENKLFDIPFSNIREIFETVENNTILTPNESQKLAILILRETIWCELVDVDNKFKFQFGYDYNMYCTSNYLEKDSIKRIEDLGLFIDKLLI